MPLKLSRYVMVLLGCAIAACSAGGASNEEPTSRAKADAAPAQQQVNPDAQTLADFHKRIDAYMDLHNKLEKQSPPLKETKDPAKIRASQDTLAEKLKAARSNAKQGDIFTPEIRTALRRLMYPETKGADGAANKAAIKEEGDELKGVTLKVNARYPDSAPLTTVPPDILAALPKLPEDLEYRFVGKHMILIDTHANIIVDFITNAIQ